MSKIDWISVIGGTMLCSAMLVAQGAPPAKSAGPSGPATVFVQGQGMVPITDRLAAATMQGTIVEISCFRSQGAATVATPDQISCGKAAVAKNTGVIGILTDGDGLFKLVGSSTANNYVKLVPFLGQRVDVAGSEVVISNNYDYHAFDAQRVTPSKK